MEKKSVTTFCIANLGAGGAQGVCVNLANGIASMGYKVEIIVLNLSDCFYLDHVHKDVSVVSLKCAKSRYSLIPMVKYIIKEKPSTLLSFDYEMSVILGFLTYIFHFNLIIRNINTFTNVFSNSKLVIRTIISTLVSHSFKRATLIINQCESMRTDLVSNLPALADKSIVINNPVANYIEKYSNSVIRDEVEKEFYILFVGRLEAQKNVEDILLAFSELKTFYADLKLKIVGEGSERRKLEDLCLRLNISNDISFEGIKNDLIPYYTKAKVTVLTSIYEGFPNVLIESIVLGTPVVSYDIPSGPREIIIEGVNGFLVERNSQKDLVAKLSEALERNWDSSIIIESSVKYKIYSIVKKYESVIF